jgi:hypothetical protein
MSDIKKIPILSDNAKGAVYRDDELMNAVHFIPYNYPTKIY